jgi:hypothetical protein
MLRTINKNGLVDSLKRLLFHQSFKSKESKERHLAKSADGITPEANEEYE